eukprot:CAMPEP_0202075438 /NCGR_PEP_ID=MMETSP0964-20121228/4209_1 /ASSEMBLY_ACC=CAM_ASM_000500 /TAXON_ID=4773 /ORGANISM="Schizochytrium aggregatum, Strain ATCC28209" /LENGTH=46 /DNA_ID= /DNA_START= /DNA_END= /DNA_ORIENTATION=
MTARYHVATTYASSKDRLAMPHGNRWLVERATWLTRQVPELGSGDL